MQNLLLSLCVAVLFLTLFGCITDPCASVVCDNFEYCDNGECICICENGGYCDNGECICPEGYEGPECRLQIQPKIIYVNLVKVRSWPETNNGISWDSSSTADICPRISKGSNIIWNNYVRFPDADNSHDYLFDVDPAISIDPDDWYTISLWDLDRNEEDDPMGDAEFKLNRNIHGFPNSININGEKVAFTLNVTYEF